MQIKIVVKMLFICGRAAWGPPCDRKQNLQIKRIQQEAGIFLDLTTSRQMGCSQMLDTEKTSLLASLTQVK